MKRCPECRRDYYDDTLLYCLDDGNALLEGPASADEPATAILSEPGAIATGFPASESPTRAQIHTTDRTAIFPRGSEAEPQKPLADSSERQSLSAHQTAKPHGKVGGMQRQLAVFAIAVVILAVGGFFGYRYFTGANSKQIESIAVMPFVNDNGDPDLEYLSDGMTETLISSLSQLPNLSVKGRSAVFRYKGKDLDTKTIGRELDVQAILYGRVIQRGDELTLSLELLDAVTENVIWSDTYNRKQTDVASLQGEIARDVSSKLKSKLSGADVAKVGKTYTADPEAYQLYLKGRFQWSQRTGESLKRSVEFFEEAIKKDPNYALAYSGLAESYVLYPSYAAGLPREAMPKARAAALRAIELDDSSPEPHVALGIYLSTFSWNQNAAEKEFLRAIELNTNYPSAHQQYGNYCLNAMQRFDEAVAEGRRAEELDPFSAVISSDLGANLTRARRYDEAIAQFDRTLSLDPNFSATRMAKGIVYQAKGQHAEAIAEFRKAIALGDDPMAKALLARSLAKLDQKGEAMKLRDELLSDSSRRYVPSSAIAIVFAALGDKDRAFVWLEKDVSERSQRPALFSVNPIFDDLRDDPRFADLIKRVEASKLD